MLIIESLINQALAFDAHAEKRLRELDGKHLEIKIIDIKKIFHIKFTHKGIHFLKREPNLKEVIVEGPLKAFLCLGLTKNTVEAAGLGLVFEGDVATLETVKALFLSLDIDWEEIVSQWTNDTVAHQIGNFVRFAKKRHNTLLKSSTESLSEYLLEELKLFPTKTEVDDFLNTVDGLRSDVDRLEARLNNIALKRGKQT